MRQRVGGRVLVVRRWMLVGFHPRLGDVGDAFRGGAEDWRGQDPAHGEPQVEEDQWLLPRAKGRTMPNFLTPSAATQTL